MEHPCQKMDSQPDQPSLLEVLKSFAYEPRVDDLQTQMENS